MYSSSFELGHRINCSADGDPIEKASKILKLFLSFLNTFKPQMKSKNPQVDSGFQEEFVVPFVLRNAAKMDLSVYASRAKTTDFLDLDGVVYCCCILYRLWIQKSPNLNNPKVTLFEFQFQPLPPGFVLDANRTKEINSPFGTQEWFPNLVQHVYRILKRSRIALPVLMVALLYIGR
jgi:hypothetical protein